MSTKRTVEERKVLQDFRKALHNQTIFVHNWNNEIANVTPLVEDFILALTTAHEAELKELRDIVEFHASGTNSSYRPFANLVQELRTRLPQDPLPKKAVGDN